MSNPLFNAMNNGFTGNIMQMIPQIRQNPMSILKKAGYNIPSNFNNPNQIIQHLVQSGQVNQNQLDYAQRMAQMLGMKQ